MHGTRRKNKMSSSGKVDCDALSATPPGCLSERWMSQLLCISLHERPVRAVFLSLYASASLRSPFGISHLYLQCDQKCNGQVFKISETLQQYGKLGELVRVGRGIEQCRQTKSMYFFFVLKKKKNYKQSHKERFIVFLIAGFREMFI